MSAIRIALFCAGCVAACGVLQEEVSARVSCAYFAVVHGTDLTPEDDPTLPAVGWGVRGSGGAGVLLGASLALVATLGPTRRLTLGHVWKPVLGMNALVAAAALTAGLGGWYAGCLGEVSLGGDWGERAPPDGHAGFVAVLAAHFAAYLATVLGSLLLCAWVAWRRQRLGPAPPVPWTDADAVVPSRPDLRVAVFRGAERRQRESPADA
jgi:hypothetical protein